MFPKLQRIPRVLFKPLLGPPGKRFDSKYFSLRVVPSKEPRFAVSVSKKISKKAVVRNRVRRRVYAAARELTPSLSGGLFLLIAKPGAEKLKGRVLKDELAELLKKG